MFLQGEIISGEFDQSQNDFSLQRVKNLYTESVLKETQLNSIYRYLKEHEHEQDGQVITLYDQMPLRLSQQETNQLVNDIERILSMYR